MLITLLSPLTEPLRW